MLQAKTIGRIQQNQPGTGLNNSRSPKAPHPLPWLVAGKMSAAAQARRQQSEL